MQNKTSGGRDLYFLKCHPAMRKYPVTLRMQYQANELLVFRLEIEDTLKISREEAINARMT